MLHERLNDLLLALLIAGSKIADNKSIMHTFSAGEKNVITMWRRFIARVCAADNLI